VQFPFVVVVEPPTLAELRQAARSRWALAAFLGIAAAALAASAFSSMDARPMGTSGAALQIGSMPAGATAVVDGQERGRTPLAIPIRAGEHRVTLRLDGYADATRAVNIQSGETAAVQAELWLRSPQVERLRPTYPGARIADASFLNDGRLAIVAALPPGDEQQLWVADPAGRFSRSGPHDARGVLALSPGGDRVAYLAPGQGRSDSEGLRDVWVSGTAGEQGERRYPLPADRRDERVLDLSWSPDGRQLLVISRKQLPGVGQRTRLLLLDVLSGETRELASLPSEVIPASCSWGPTGEWIALLTRSDRLTSLCLVGTGGEFRYLADLAREDAGTLSFPPLAWYSDGRRVLYAAPTQDRSSSPGWPPSSKPSNGLFVTEPLGAATERLGSAVGYSPAWRGDGSMVAFARAGNGTVSLHLVNPSGEPQELAQLPVKAGASFAARWDVARGQAILAVRGAANTVPGQVECWLVRFRPEAVR
jgi:hypothetical protein